MASLSKLFSENSSPYLDYRLAENLFARYFSAVNDARSCTAFDARIGNIGIGIKTFLLKNNGTTSVEKIAEFNKCRLELENLRGDDLALKLATLRNNRIEESIRIYNLEKESSRYHIVGRVDGGLKIFNLPYKLIDINSLKVTKEDDTGIHFKDKFNKYAFNRSKTVLQMRFDVPKEFVFAKVEMIEDPLTWLLNVFGKEIEILCKKESKKDYVLLPLYSVRDKNVPERSGLNQWNARGRNRNRDVNEVYISIPAVVHKTYPNFFPKRDKNFSLKLPNGEILSAKVCQDGGKALMSNPNKDLGRWLLRDVLHKKEGELVTMSDLNEFGFDCIRVEKENESTFSLSFGEYNQNPFEDR